METLLFLTLVLVVALVIYERKSEKSTYNTRKPRKAVVKKVKVRAED